MTPLPESLAVNASKIAALEKRVEHLDVKLEDLADRVSEFVGAVKLLAFILSASVIGQVLLQFMFHKQ